MSFDLRHLRYVVAAADHRSFFRAALALEIEQSSMSRAILRLEQRLGAKLFRRSHAGVAPTPAGAEFIHSARQILAKADALTCAMQSAVEGRAGRLTIGISHSAVVAHLEEILVAWRQLFPDLDVEKVEGSRDLLLAALDAQVIDIAILPGDRLLVGMRQAPLWGEDLMQRRIPFSGYWRSDNDNPARRRFVSFVRERSNCQSAESGDA